MSAEPRVVALGGGHGLAATLAAARRYAGEVTAIVSVADDGGSSGRLRRALGTPPPGDLRKCLVALGDADRVWGRAFEHRFAEGELEGHALGNLVISGLAEVTGDFLAALAEAGRLVGAVGEVVPATRSPVVLKAQAPGGEDVEGQVAIGRAGPVAGVSVVPADPEVYPQALDALARADQVVIGPGSLFTSVLAVVAVPALREALARTRGRKVYVCNLRPQMPETAGFDVAAHVEALLAHGVDIDVVVCDSSTLPLGKPSPPVVDRRLARPDGLAHDPARLAAVLEDLVR
ncbi:MAG TPA: uridine diphosphate-N-acetylglucosamine-binding protein YvcK [Acidimicrobiales bacterium]|nr:uridine diphosphate-N-acetylglucosamine-binding protein YvcK [Acidimicrobiales bacterium]